MKTDFHHHDYEQVEEKSEEEVYKALFSQKPVFLREPEEADRRLVRPSYINPSKSSARFKS